MAISQSIPPVAEDQVSQVRAAMENSPYVWRTIDGMAAETNLSPELIREALKVLRNEVIRSTMNWEDSFTTRRHYRQKAPLWNRFLAALRNEAY